MDYWIEYMYLTDKKWLTSSRTSLTSVASSRPELPPKNIAYRELPPPLPEKPRTKSNATSVLSRKGTPALPQRCSVSHKPFYLFKKFETLKYSLHMSRPVTETGSPGQDAQPG